MGPTQIEVPVAKKKKCFGYNPCLEEECTTFAQITVVQKRCLSEMSTVHSVI